MGLRPPKTAFLFLIWILLIRQTSQNTRSKRQIQPEQPRILTQNGHLIFQSGTNHNITFKATAGGYINVNGDDLTVITQTVKNNKLAIDRLQVPPTGTTSNVENRLRDLESRLNNLQPTGQVQLVLTNLGHRIDLLQATMPQNVGTRLSQLESQMNNLQPTGQVQTTLNQLTSRLTTVENRVNNLQNLGTNDVDALQQRVNRLETTVNNLQTLLTTNECASNPCRNGATCVDTYNGFFCRCTAGFQGPICDDDVNECAVYAGTDLGCQNGASCTNTIGSFTCQCATNWHGVRCTESHDDCTGASSSELCGHGTCVNQARVQPGQPKYTCICDDGWTSSGSDPACTTDVDECAGSRPPCSVSPPVPCINLPGSFQCGPCPPGYNGNGFSCVDINECATNNGGCSLAPRVECVNTEGSRTCGPCPSGYQGDGVTCNWVGLCQNNNGGCHPLASCAETPGFEGRECTCPQGYVGNGVGPTGCVSQGPIAGPCGSAPCLNGAVCQNVGDSSYRCTCQAGYTGQQCQTNIDECASGPCQNGGTCIDRVNGYICQCPTSVSGPSCEIEQQTCGGMYTSETGTFSYPATPGTTYPHDVSCAWRVTTTYGKILRITFPTFNIEPHVNCAYDFLQIHDGPTASSYMIGKYCGSTPPNNNQPINSTHHQLYFWFRSDVSIASDGFTVAWTSADPVCGGNLDGANHGEFSSPGYPGNYPHDRTCVWTVTVPPGNMIMFTFATLAIETHPDCNYDYVEIRDGGLDTSPLLQRYCNTTTPAPLTTTGPTAWVKFHSDSSYSDQGFHITYAAVSAGAQCGGNYNSETGILISPNYPNPYNHDASCVWIITVNERDTVTLTFTNMELEGHPDCQYDYVEVRDGPNEMAPLLGRYCGDFMPTPLTTTGNTVYVKFRSDVSVATSGFRATWAVACGGTFTSPTGVLRSPYYPDHYPSNRVCEYLINQPVGNRITLTFSFFDVEGGSCQYDYLEVRDGGSSDSPIMGTYCGPQMPDPLTTTSNFMYLKFVTDGSVQNNGFEASYEIAEGGCGQSLTDPTGTITSPGHPNTYPHGVNCTWFVRVEPGLVVRLTFHTFSIESHPNCVYDALSVFDDSGANTSSLIGRYCGSTFPPTVTSTNNFMTVVFESDSSVAHEGFSASYVSLNATTLCGSDLTDSTGMIMSPNFPDNYPHQRECTWTITAPEGNQILLNVTDFILESHYNCLYDFLEIRNGGFSTSPLVGKYCGTTIDRLIVSHSNRMYLRFVTDPSLSAPGFRIFYDATATGCGADLTTPSGSFTSPNYPSPYGHNAECIWTITASRGSTIQLSFVDIEIELHGNCAYDYVEVRERNQVGRLLGTFCGSTIPDPITSTGNILWVKYRTDYSISGRGFHAAYQSLCSNTLTDFSGVIESPNFPQPYPHNRNCTWIIDTTMGNTVNFSFSHFEIESHSNCQYDYLQIRDGNSETAPLLGNYCGTNLPPPMASSGEQVWINFVSDYSVARNGFRMEYVTNGCGGYLTTPTGSFTSPGYPNPYDHRRVCEWKIVVPTGQYIQLTIETFDLETHSNCNYDVLEIYGGPDDGSPRLAQLCHTQSSPQRLSTTGNQMFVRFKSDISVNGRGFNATYKSASGGCGGNFTTPSGSIVSPNYPSNYGHNTDCEWLITVEERHAVVLTFVDFDVEGAADCAYDYVVVYDGPDPTFPELLRFCGASLPAPSVYRSHSNQMYIRMRTDTSISAKGFKADYETGCGGTLNAETDGDIVSPNYPGEYPGTSNCSWLIQADHSSDRITLTFTHMDLEVTDGCNKDYVQVLDGVDEMAPVVGRYCGTTVPSPITSQGMALFVQFVSDAWLQASGFRAAYTKSTSACGGDFTAQSGSFMSPGYPNSYPTNTECVWTITVPPGGRVQLSFSLFSLEQHSNCNYDYLELHEGQLGGPLIGRFCGNTIPSNLTSYNGLWMKFRSDDSNTGQGFIAYYSTTYGGDISGTSGQIASPNYPRQYPHNTDYTWTITVSMGMRVRVTFDTMDMEAVNCQYDYVRFRDGGSADSPELGSYCGTTLPDMFISTTNQLQVEFHSDWSATGQGFLFSWEATSDMPITTLPPTAGTTPVPGCGGFLNVTDAVQTVTSPGYPNDYLNHLTCEWRMNTALGSHIWMNITDIDIESHSTCSYDILTIYDAPTASGIVLGTFCGRDGNDNPLSSTRNSATIKFTSDFSVTRRGFSLQYKAVCGGLVQANSGVLTSPGYPNNYPANSNCSWLVIVATGRTVRVRFDTNFNVPGTQGSCGRDYVQLLNGFYQTSPPLGNTTTDGRYCGNTPPVTMETSSYFLRVNFISDGSGSGVGFSLFFHEVHVTCGGRLTLSDTETSGTFMSPNYPGNYPHNVDCVWLITAPASERIQLDFIDQFAIESHPQCNYDYVEVRDGGTINSVLIGRYCGYTAPSTVFSTGNVMFVRFRTDASVPRVGIKGQYKLATCGGRLSGSSATITSPNYPNSYGTNVDCSWVVEGPAGHFLTFTFLSLNTESAQNCTMADYIEIREINSTGNLLQRTCGSTVPTPVITSDNFGYVRFRANGQTQTTGLFSLKFEASIEECGGTLTTRTGSFQSPNFPGNYPHSRICEWRIMVPFGRRITISFSTFSIEDHSTCAYDYTEVFNGILTNSARVGRYCGEESPGVVETSGNTARIVFRTDGSVSNGGFQAYYSSFNEAYCGGRLTASSGNISSPGYETGNYTNNLECIWTLANPQLADSSIVVRFNTLRLETASSCQHDWLEFREGNNENGLLLDQHCGNNTFPPPIISPVPYMYIRFHTDHSIVDHGFHISYNFTQCGGVLNAPMGEISSPDYPRSYAHDYACAWQIVAPEGSQIVVEFIDFDIMTSPSCFFQYLEIFNGPYASSPSAGRFCGNTMPANFRSQSSSVRLVLFSHIGSSARGFRLRYSFTTEGCGGLFHSNDGYLSTPNYPSSYPHNTECMWDINVGPGYHVALTFNPPFDMEHHGACDYDFVEVSDALLNGTLVPLGRYCKNILPPVQRSSGTRMVVHFRSDATTNGNGFSANWTSDCGGVITGSSGTLLSPGFPNQYGHNLRCNYTLNMDPQHFIVLEFDQNNFAIEAGNNCGYDFLAVYQGNSSSGRLLGKFCGTSPPQALSALGQMYIQFWTDGSIAGGGWRASYRVSQCGGIFTEPSGVIETPTHPVNYHNNQNCTWSVTVEQNRVVDIKFLSFELEAHSTCNYDYLDIFDGPDINSPRIGRYCGDVLPTDLIRSTSNTMTLNFVTDFFVTRGGFRLVYRTTFGVAQGCGGNLNSTTGSFSSIDGNNDGQYENNLDCRWNIFGGDNKVVQLSISRMDIEQHPSCRYDYIKVYDGISAEDALIGTYCGNTAPPMITATSNVLYVQFYSDVSITGAGFNATYTQANAACGGTVTATTSPQTITSPNYPYSARQNLRCRWTIDAPSDNQQIEIVVTAINLQSTSGCSPEYLEIRDYPLGLVGRTVHACGTTAPPVFDSFGRTAQINYAVTDSGSTGFSLTYKIATCNRTYTGDRGQIFSPGWPGRYQVNLNCIMQIQAPQGTTVSLYFNSFHIEPHSNCNYDYLEIRNGSTSVSPVLGKFCGRSLPPPVFATTNTVHLSFVTDRSVTSRGYDITYTATSQGVGCGGNITGINGSLTSPGYPNTNSSDSSVCNWAIQVPARRQITLTFTDMRMFDPVNCATDYVIVYNGNSDTSPIFGRYCGGEIPAPLTTAGNQAFVKYVSDGVNTSIGFRLTFTS